MELALSYQPFFSLPLLLYPFSLLGYILITFQDSHNNNGGGGGGGAFCMVKVAILKLWLWLSIALLHL
jgi:hypothetical protein